MNNGVIVLGLDAMDPNIAARMAADGQLPNLKAMMESGARCKVRNPFGLFVGALWVSFATATRPDRHGFHCWDEIEVESYRRRLNSPAPRRPPFWQALGDAGRRVATLDVPHAKADPRHGGLQLVEWGCHDRHHGFHSWPPGRAGDVAGAFGLHPVMGMDAYAVRDFAPDDLAHRAGRLRTRGEERALAHDMRLGLSAKRRLVSALLAEEDWDLFVAVYGESHAVGHQQWHLHDPAHPRFDAAVTEAAGGDPLLQCYRDLDAGVGEAMTAAGPEATMLVLLSHGMGAHHDGTHMLDEILTRLDLHDRGAPPLADARDLLDRAVRPLPLALRKHMGKLGKVRAFASPAARARQPFFLEPNNSVYGGIRLNIAGREPRGCVDPAQAERVAARLEADLLEIVNVATGRPLITRVTRADRHYRRDPADRMPDLFLHWDRSAAAETVASPKIGRIHAAYTKWRTGDHRPSGMLLARGPGIAAGRLHDPIYVEDIAPSIAARMGVLLDDVDGVPAPWLAGGA